MTSYSSDQLRFGGSFVSDADPDSGELRFQQGGAQPPRGDDGRFLSLELGRAVTCDDECLDDNDRGFTAADLNACHANGAFYMDSMESAAERVERLTQPEIDSLHEDGSICCLSFEDVISVAGDDPLEACCLMQQVRLARAQRDRENAVLWHRMERRLRRNAN